jgi:agmatine/peptidylarginine deiminase
MSQDCNVTTIVASTSEQTYVTNQYQNQGVNLDNCDFMIAPSNSYWTRDYGPWFVIDGNDELGIVDFEYNRPRPADNAIPSKVAQYMDINLFAMDIETAGGNYMCNGMGIASSSDLIWVENNGYTHAQIDEIFEEYLGIEEYYVLDDPNNTYIDHIDCWGKFLDVDKVLIRSVPTSHAQYDEIEATAAYYAEQISTYGTPFEVYRVYTPNDQPYTNSLILNKKVIVPIMNSQWDDEALAAYEEAMPGYTVVGYTGSWESTDALHCRTKGLADKGMLHINHVAIMGEQPVQTEYLIEATIKNLSGQPTYSDSALIYFRVNGAAWEMANMSNTSGQLWTGEIPGASQGSEIEYYLYVADESGRHETHPLIGEPDPHKFFVGEQGFAQINIYPASLSVTAPEGQITEASFTISNLGTSDLYYNIETNTAVLEEIDYTVEDSPSADSYDYNTYDELGWTDLEVADMGEVAAFEITYTWITDTWPEDASFHVESPEGTTVVIADGLPSGTYTVDATAFNGEEMEGNWKIWIEDSYGDGGNQATDITVTITRVESEIEWMGPITPGTGIVAAGESAIVSVPCSALELEAGTYEGTIIVSSNDLLSPEVLIPVTFIVTELADITVSPDSLYFLTIEDMAMGKMINISNQTDSDIMISEITETGSNFMWMFEPPLPSLPYNLEAGQELELNVIIPLPPVPTDVAMLYDNLMIETEVGTHTVVVAWDSDLLALNVTSNPDTIWVIEQSQVGEHTFSVTNNSNIPVILEEVNASFWWVYYPVTLPYEMLPQETVEMQVSIIGVVPDEYIEYDSIMITTTAGINKIMMVIDMDLISDIEEALSQEPTIFPNPFTDQLSIDLPASEASTKVELLDINGRLVAELFEGIPSYQQTIRWNANDQNGNKVKNGIYFIRISSDEKSEMIKVIKMD